MSELIAGESIFFHHYETSEYVQYDAIVRVCEEGISPEVNLSWFNDGVESQANNVKNIEDPALGATEDYWRGRYGGVVRNQLLELGNRFLFPTVRVEKNDMVLFRPWDETKQWGVAYIAVVVATLGAPADPHPRVNLRYVDTSGTSVLVSTVEPYESFTDEEDAVGNDLWSNIPEFIILSVGI